MQLRKRRIEDDVTPVVPAKVPRNKLVPREKKKRAKQNKRGADAKNKEAETPPPQTANNETPDLETSPPEEKHKFLLSAKLHFNATHHGEPEVQVDSCGLFIRFDCIEANGLIGQIRILRPNTVHVQRIAESEEVLGKDLKGAAMRVFECVEVPRGAIRKIIDPTIDPFVPPKKEWNPPLARWYDISQRDKDGECHVCAEPEESLHFNKLGFKLKGEQYGLKQFVFLNTKGVLSRRQRRRYLKRGTVKTPMPYVVGQIKEIIKGPQPQVKLSMLARPEEFFINNVYECHPQELIVTDQVMTVNLSDKIIVGKAYVGFSDNVSGKKLDELEWWLSNGPNRFFVQYSTKINDPEKMLQKIYSVPWRGDFNLKNGETKSPPFWPTLDKKLRTLDLFCGAGGLARGLTDAKLAKIVMAVDSDADCAEAYRKNFPGATVHNKPLEEIEKEFEADPKPFEGIELVIGGPPCQGFSGLNRHLEAERAVAQRALYFQSVKFALKLKPDYILLENVRTIATVKGGFYLRQVIHILLEKGYQVTFQNVQAASFGVPQSRQRVFLFAAKEGKPLFHFPAPTHCTSAVCHSVTFSGVKVGGMGGAAFYREVWCSEAVPDLNSKDGKTYNKDEYYTHTAFQLRRKCKEPMDHEVIKLPYISQVRVKKIPPNGNWLDLLDIHEFISFQDEKSGKMITEPMCPTSIIETAERNGDWERAYSRCPTEGIANIICTVLHLYQNKGNPIHMTQDRVLTIRELARFQSIPDDFFFFGNPESRLRQVGNAVPPLLACNIARNMILAIQKK